MMSSTAKKLQTLGDHCLKKGTTLIDKPSVSQTQFLVVQRTCIIQEMSEDVADSQDIKM